MAILYEELMGKNGIATVIVAKELLLCPIGKKIPTISELVDKYKLARGTVQNAIKLLSNKDAIRIESKGHLGSYLTKKNTSILLKYAGIDSLLGTMPLPYSKRYEGLASGIIASLENNFDLPISLAYMRGSKNRIAMVLQGRYDFAIVSKYSAVKFIEQYPDKEIEIVANFGPKSYLNSHVIMFHNPKDTKIKDGMRVGIDSLSVDQAELVRYVCKDINVEFIETEYSKMIDRIKDGDIDATVMNEDEAKEKNINIKMCPIDNLRVDNTEAVIVIAKGNDTVRYLIHELLDTKTVLDIQELVMSEKITPSY